MFANSSMIRAEGGMTPLAVSVAVSGKVSVEATFSAKHAVFLNKERHVTMRRAYLAGDGEKEVGKVKSKGRRRKKDKRRRD